MKKVTLCVTILLAAVGIACAQDTITPRMGLVQPAIGSANWGPKVDANYSILDTSAAVQSSSNVFTSPLGNTFTYNVKGGTFTCTACSQNLPVLTDGTSTFTTGLINLATQSTGTLPTASLPTDVMRNDVAQTMISSMTNNSAGGSSTKYGETTGTMTVTSLSAHGPVIGNSPLTTVSPGALDTLLQGQGTSADPAFSTAISSCGDSSHAVSYSTTTHSFGCQAITGTASAGGSNGDVQYNNGGALAGVTGTTTGQMLIAQGAGVAPIFASGRIMQIVPWSSTAVSSTTATPYIKSNINVSITPLSTGSTIYIYASIGVYVAPPSTAGHQAEISLKWVRGASTSLTDGYAHGAVFGATSQAANVSPGSSQATILDYDKPNTTSNITYTLELQNDAQEGEAAINVSIADSPLSNGFLIEVGP